LDNLTHSLAGVMLSRAGLNRVTPRATVLSVMAANAPDIDIVSLFWGGEAYLLYHRWATHAVVFVPLVAILPVLLLRVMVRGPVKWGRAYFVSFVGTASHPLLDFTNPYGIRLWLPWSEAWPRLDVTSVIDVWIWAALLLSTAWPAISRLVSSEMGARKTTGRGWAIFALLFLLVYSAARVVLHDRAIAVQQARLFGGTLPKSVNVMPSPINPLVWRGFVETDRFWATHTVDLSREFDPTATRIVYKSENSAAIEAARRVRVIQVFLGWSRASVWRVSPADDRSPGYTKVECLDLRLGAVATAVFDAQWTVQESSFRF
jgi:inner membrane protein